MEGKVSEWSSHVVDANGVEVWSYTHKVKKEYFTKTPWGRWFETDQEKNQISASATLDKESKSKIIAEAERIYDAVLDRGMSRAELEALVLHVNGGVLNSTGFASHLMSPSAHRYFPGPEREFDLRFGELSNADFAGRIYLNALSRAPSMDELNKALTFLHQQGASGRAALAVDIANSSEHFVVGNHSRSTNNMELDLSPPKREALLDRAAVHASIERLFDTVYNRAPSAHELEYLGGLMMDEGRTLTGIAAELRSLTVDLFGAQMTSVAGLSGHALVERAYMNALGRLPSSAEAGVWTAHLAANRISPDEFLAALSESVEHLASGAVYQGATNAAITLGGDGSSQTLRAGATSTVLFGFGGNDTLIGSARADELHGGSGNDFLRGGGGSDRYFWSPGDGNDRIEDGSASAIEGDELYLAVMPDAVSLAREIVTERYKKNGKWRTREVETDNLKITVGGEAIVVVDHYKSRGLECIVFIDGTMFHLADPWQVYGGLGADTLNGDEGRNSLQGLGGNDVIDGRGGFDWLFGNGGDDTLLGGAGDDRLRGGHGSDYVAGGAGNDTYMWARGDGSDTIDENADTASWLDSLILKDVRSSEVTLQRSGQDSLLVVAPSEPGGVNGGTLRLINLGAAGNQGVDRVVLSDATWTRSDLQAMALQAATTPGHDSIVGFAGRDVLSGGAGNDVLTGLGGNDQFVFKERFGADRITDFAAGAGAGDVLQLSLGTAFDSFEEVRAVASQVKADTVINFGDLGSITLQNVAVTSLAADDFLFAA
jgi:Ca2+-binding RTX toxin-like protein